MILKPEAGNFDAIVPDGSRYDAQNPLELIQDEIQRLERWIAARNRVEICSCFIKLAELIKSTAAGKPPSDCGEAFEFQQTSSHLRQGQYDRAWDTLKSYFAPSSSPDALRAQIAVAMYLENQALSLITSFTTRKVQANINPQLTKGKPSLRQWVKATSPARIDLAGGWTDTPPICNDRGGAVVGVAVQLDGKRPIGCRVRRILEKVVLLRKKSSDQDGQSGVRYTSLLHLQNFTDPTAEFALVKACFHLATSSDGTDSAKCALEDLLTKSFESGIELETWSDLPEGSGLGTSSILAGCIMASLWDGMGMDFSQSDLIHGVLQVEQLLTTGGGWQDQVNGLLPGVKLGQCLPKEPLTVTWETVPLETPFMKVFEDHLILIYTGKVRLAKNLLETVVRAWYSKKDAIYEAIGENHLLAGRMWSAIRNESITNIGAHLNRYWELKKTLAEGSEPDSIVPILKATRPLCVGQSLCGAGGGGFLVLITRQPNQMEPVERAMQGLGGTCHRVKIDNRGLELRRCD
eukprot:maker-scaffold1072_size64607-snap-gene-0.16 protein:Tk04385 transcript:maker-scaffold1072_size64607-snap-gene-0.16-mRNA-1 annotation:"l-fucose kinase-like"